MTADRGALPVGETREQGGADLLRKIRARQHRFTAAATEFASIGGMHRALCETCGATDSRWLCVTGEERAALMELAYDAERTREEAVKHANRLIEALDREAALREQLAQAGDSARELIRDALALKEQAEAREAALREQASELREWLDHEKEITRELSSVIDPLAERAGLGRRDLLAQHRDSIFNLTKRAEAAEAREAALRHALVTAAVPLEALNLVAAVRPQDFEPSVREAIAEACVAARAALAGSPDEETS